MSRRVRVAGILAAGALTTAAAGAFSGALALAAPPAHATPAEDCEAVRARDHQIYLNMIAALPPGSPIPPEYINPCLTAPSTTTAPPALPGQAGQRGQAGPGLQVGANAPTLMPRYNGTDIVPVPGAAVPAAPGAPAGAENTPGRDVPGSSAGPDTAAPQPSLPGTSTPTATSDRGPGPVPAANDVPVHPESAPVAVSPTDPGEGRNRLLELALLGAAAFAAAGAGAGVRGRRTPFGARAPESVLSQAVGTLAAPLMQYAPGGQSQLRVADPFNEGSRFFYLIHDRTSSHEAEIPVTVPPGGHMAVNPDSSVTVFDADGSPVSTVEAPWAYDANGKPIPTHYEVRDGKLVQVVDTTGLNPLYPILADPLTPEERATLEEQAGFIGPMTPAGEQARKNAQAILAANPVQAAADPADSDLAQLMLADPDSQVSEPPITDTGTGNPLGDTILANQTQQPVTSTNGGTDYTTEPADPADSDLAQLMLADPDSQVSEPPIAETGTGSPLGDVILAEQTQQPVTSGYGGQSITAYPKPEYSDNIESEPAFTLDQAETESRPAQSTNYNFTRELVISPQQQAANQLARAHGDVPEDFTGNVPLTAQEQLADLEWHINRLRDAGFSDADIVRVLDGTEYSPDIPGSVLAGGLSTAELAAKMSSRAVEPGRHAIRAAEALEASRLLGRFGRSLPVVGAAVSVADGALTLADGGPIPETVGASGGGIAGGIAGAWAGAEIGAAGGPVGILIGAGIGGALGVVGGGAVGHLIGRGVRALWTGTR
ncbi:hypothetical protein [Rhodococcus sp. OK302]|uniref:hypothetical protein n=1 Tax=Rhodococcus sp. OK302 TaxID=1882769 RepID=UPI000B93D5FB|nr:hypothetical protein [Rhodococcus sp. OK302]OYD61214.1 hypothetical protein BDB13_6171 [Rhodococcus sp. OK302]